MATDCAYSKINNALSLFSLKFIGKESISLTCKMGPCINDFRVAALTERLTEKRVQFCMQVQRLDSPS